MLARFGWAVMKLAKEHVQTPRAFDFSAFAQEMVEDDDDEDGGVDGDGGGMRMERMRTMECGSQEPIRKKLKTSHTEEMPTRRSSRKKKESRTHLEPEVIQRMLLLACIEYDTD